MILSCSLASYFSIKFSGKSLGFCFTKIVMLDNAMFKFLLFASRLNATCFNTVVFSPFLITISSISASCTIIGRGRLILWGNKFAKLLLDLLFSFIVTVTRLALTCTTFNVPDWSVASCIVESIFSTRSVATPKSISS